MSAVMPEFRTPVMTLVEASWEDQSGVWQAAPARMEDRSAGGACIRIKTPVTVGARLRIQWRCEQFSGIARYCRKEDEDYLVGIQRDAAKSHLPNRPVPPRPEELRKDEPVVSASRIQSPPKRPESMSVEIPVSRQELEGVSIGHAGNGGPAPPPRRVDHEIDNGEGRGTSQRTSQRISQPQDFDSPRETALSTKQPPNGKESGKERKHMGRKWLELAPWRNKQDGDRVSGDGNSGKSEKENLMPHATQPTEKSPVRSAREVPNFQVELLPMEDIYRAAGIMNPRQGYSINKVVEMLHSEHIRGLSQEMKRAAVLMALDAAGVSIDQLQHDAKARQNALDSHEADQRTQVEAEWARKAEEVIQIQAELESIKAHYTARISRNLEGVAREKATFNAWLGLKQQESQSISEAMDLCLKAPVPAPASKSESSSPRPEFSRAAASARQDPPGAGIH